MKKDKYFKIIKQIFKLMIVSISLSQPDMVRFVKDVWPENSCASLGGVKPTLDGGYIIPGCKSDSAWLMKVDMYGNKEWENTYNLMDYWGKKTVIQTSDGGYLFAGWVGIVKVDSLGNKEWKNQNHPAGMGTYPYYEDIIEHSNGKYYAVGGPGNGGLALIVKFSRDGQVLKRKWHGGNCDNDRFKSVIESADGRLIAVGAKVHGNSGYPCSFEWYDDFWIVKLGLNGSKVWEKTYGGDYYEEAHDIVRIESGGYGIIGEKCPDTPSHCTNATRVMYLQIDENGNQVSSDIFNRNGFCSGHAITTTHDGGIAWVGERGNYNLWMYQWDSNNQPLEVTEQLGPGYSIEKTHDGGFVISTGSNIIKTDAEFNFNEDLFTEEIIDEVPSEFKLYQNYPNPFNPKTIIRFDLPKESNVKILIYDILGRLTKKIIDNRQDTGFKSIQWDGTNNYGKKVPDGVYLYSIEAENFRQTKKMILLK